MNSPNIANKANLKLRNIYKRAFIYGSKSKYVFKNVMFKSNKKDSQLLNLKLKKASRLRVLRITIIISIFLSLVVAVAYVVNNL